MTAAIARRGLLSTNARLAAGGKRTHFSRPHLRRATLRSFEKIGNAANENVLANIFVLNVATTRPRERSTCAFELSGKKEKNLK